MFSIISIWVIFFKFLLYREILIESNSANTLTEDPDIRIIRISEPEASVPHYPDIRIIRVSVLFGYPNYPYYPDIRIIRVSGSGYLFITKLRIVYRPV